MVLNTDTPAALARQAQKGDQTAFAELIARLQSPLYRFLAVRTAASQTCTEELVQETFVAAWRSLERYDPERPLLPWLFTIARRVAADAWRRGQRHPCEPLQHELQSDELDPAQASERAEQQDNLWRLAARVLDAEQRSALWLRYVEDLSPQQIGVILGRRGASVRVLLFRARQRLAAALAPERAAADLDRAGAGATSPCTGGA